MLCLLFIDEHWGGVWDSGIDSEEHAMPTTGVPRFQLYKGQLYKGSPAFQLWTLNLQLINTTATDQHNCNWSAATDYKNAVRKNAYVRCSIMPIGVAELVDI